MQNTGDPRVLQLTEKYDISFNLAVRSRRHETVCHRILGCWAEAERIFAIFSRGRLNEEKFHGATWRNGLVYRIEWCRKNHY